MKKSLTLALLLASSLSLRAATLLQDCRFEGNINDSSGNGYTLVNVVGYPSGAGGSSTPLFVTGQAACSDGTQAWWLNSLNGGEVLTQGSSFKSAIIGAGTFSIRTEVWIDAATPTVKFFDVRHDGLTEIALFYNHSGSDFSFLVGTDGNFQTASSMPDITNQCAIVDAVYSSSDTKILINGNLVYSLGSGTTISSSIEWWTVGTDIVGNSRMDFISRMQVYLGALAANTPTITPTLSRTETPTITQTSTITLTSSITKTWSQTKSSTFTRTVTPSATPTRTITPSRTMTFTRTPTPVVTPPTPLPTATLRIIPLKVVVVVTPTLASTKSNTPTPSRTPSPSSTATPSDTRTATATATPSATRTRTPTASVTP